MFPLWFAIHLTTMVSLQSFSLLWQADVLEVFFFFFAGLKALSHIRSIKTASRHHKAGNWKRIKEKETGWAAVTAELNICGSSGVLTTWGEEINTVTISQQWPSLFGYVFTMYWSVCFVYSQDYKADLKQFHYIWFGESFSASGSMFFTSHHWEMHF